ncbi:MAG: potassium-transporting ATPase subunit KdpC [Sphingomicrobium sp.]
MSEFASAIRPSIVMTIGFTLLCGIAYPLAVTGVGQVALPYQANGSVLVDAAGKPIGSELIAQGFARPGYFHPRPSAAGKGYDATASGGTNLAPGSKDLHDRIQKDVAALQKEGVTTIPADLVTTSASGLDPEISPEAALVQVPRIARARGFSPEQVQDLINKTSRGALIGFIGEPRINVLALNRQLDAMFAIKNK